MRQVDERIDIYICWPAALTQMCAFLDVWFKILFKRCTHFGKFWVCIIITTVIMPWSINKY